MNVNASKVLLFVSIAGFTYCAWDHVFPPEKPVIPPAKSKDLSAGMVNRTIPLALASDPFGSTPLDRGSGEVKATRRHIAGVLDDGIDKPLPQLSLQGILFTPSGPIALISGKSVAEGEIATIEEGKARIRARRIGEDFAVVEAAAQLHMLKLERAPAARSATGSAAGAGEPTKVGQPIYQSRVSSAGN